MLAFWSTPALRNLHSIAVWADDNAFTSHTAFNRAFLTREELRSNAQRHTTIFLILHLAIRTELVTAPWHTISHVRSDEQTNLSDHTTLINGGQIFRSRLPAAHS